MTREEYNKKSNDILDTIKQTEIEINYLQDRLNSLDKNIRLQDVRNKIDKDIDSYRADFEMLRNYRSVPQTTAKIAELKAEIENKNQAIKKLKREQRSLSMNSIYSFFNRKQIEDINRSLSSNRNEANELAEILNTIMLTYPYEKECFAFCYLEFKIFCEEFKIEYSDVSKVLKLDFCDFNDLLEKRRKTNERISQLQEKRKLYFVKKEQLDYEYASINDENKNKNDLVNRIIDSEFPSSEYSNPGTNLGKYDRKKELLGMPLEELKHISSLGEKQFVKEKV